MKDKDKSKDKRRENENEEKDMNAEDGTRTEFADFAEMRWSHVRLHSGECTMAVKPGAYSIIVAACNLEYCRK
jgi:hypothetical protein